MYFNYWDQFKSNTYSQNGEDGILQEMLRRLNIFSGQFFEAGAWDGVRYSNTRRLLENGWQGVYIEADPDKYRVLLDNVKNYATKVSCINAYITDYGKTCLDNLLINTPLRNDFDVFSLDLDGPDIACWQTMVKYCPKIVCIEIDPRAYARENYVHADKNIPKHPHLAHCSGFGPVVTLAIQKNYCAVCHIGSNVIFIRKDLAERLGNVNPNPYSIFNPYRIPKVQILSCQQLFAKYKGLCETFIETGTWKGDGVQSALDAGFTNVISYEANPKTYSEVIPRFAGNTHVKIYNETSAGKIFMQTVMELKTPAFFWLDGHPMTGAKCETTPLKTELNRLYHAPCKKHVILIDDVRLFESRFNVSVSGVMQALVSVNPEYKFKLETKHPEYHRDVLVCVT